MFNNFPPTWLRIPHREDIVFSVTFLFSFIVPILFVPFFYEGFETVKYPLFLFLCGVGVIAVLKRKESYLSKTALVLLGIFWLAYLASTVFSIDVINSIVGLYGRYPGSLFFITSWILFIGLVWGAVRNEETRRLTLLRVVVFNGLAISVLGILQHFNIGYYGGVSTQVRPIIPSFIGNQNFYAMYLLAVIPAAIVLWNQVQARWAGYYYVLSALVATFAVILSGSRGGILGLAAMGLIFLGIALVGKYPKKYLYGILGVIAFAGILYISFFASLRSDTLPGIGSAAEYSSNTRYIIWSQAASIIGKNPLLGTGAGNFYIEFQALGNVALSGNERFDDAHNLVLHLATTVGIPAVVMFLAIMGYAVLISWRKIGSQEPTAIWVIASLGGVMVAGCFNPVSISIWFIIGLAVAFGTSYVSQPVSVKNVFKAVVFMVSAALMIFAITFITSEILMVYGKRAYRAADNARAEQLFGLAKAFNPANSGALIFHAGSQINMNRDSEQIAADIEHMLNQHKRSAGLHKSGADLYYRLYLFTKNEAYKARMTEILREAVELEPNNATVYGSAAYLNYKVDQDDEAMWHLTRQLSLPDNMQYPYSWILKGDIHLQRGEKELALDALEKAYSQMPGQLIIKIFIEEVKRTEDVKTLKLPVFMPEVDI